MLVHADMQARAGRLRLLLILFLAALPLASAAGRELRLSADRVAQGPALAEGLQLVLSEGQEPGAGLALRLRLERLQLEELGYDFRQLDWSCELRPRDVAAWHCEGPLKSAAGSAGDLLLDWRDGDTELRLLRGRARLRAELPGEATVLSIEAERLPAEWLQPLLGTLWSSATLTGGSLGAELELDLGLDPARIEGEVRADALGLDTADGSIATAGLNLQGRLGLELGGSRRVGTELVIAGGELLFGPAYLALPAQPVRLQLEALAQGEAWRIESLRWNDPEVLELSVSGVFDFAAADVEELILEARSKSAALLVPRYLDSVLGTLGLPGLEASGGLALQTAVESGRVQSLRFDADSLQVADGGGRFALADLDGRLAWSRASTAVPSTLSWSAASLHTIELGAARLSMESAEGVLALRQPARVPVLGGALEFEQFRWRPEAEPDGGDRIALSARLQSLDMAALSTALGWPAFGGTLSGSIPEVDYRDGVLALGGALEMRVFDGVARVEGLTVERPFGVAPTLAADVELKGLDLQPLTGAFDFGEISGRMDGYIRGLRLVDWEPVAFDARFTTDESAGDKRRISQRAVRDLSAVGGMGAVASLQQGVMRMFETFPYARIGIGCKLANDVCQMSGIEANARGYTIVEGAGLPRITVNGFQRQVDWPVLVERLLAVTRSGGAVVE
jgi:hypothetical protein